LILIAFLVGLVLVVAATVHAVLRGLVLWRQVKSTGRAFSTELARFEERSARTERLLAEADTSSQALVAAQERLRISRARLNILLRAFEDDKRRTRWLRVFVPTR
jgi:hypothetical protein